MDPINPFAYSFGTEGDFHKDMKLLKQDLIDPGNIDYDYELHHPKPPCEAAERVPNTAVGRHPISFLEIRDAQEAEQWYATHHPEYPDYLCEVLAQYNFGQWRRKPRIAKPRTGIHAVRPPSMLKKDQLTLLQFD